ncbi:MAG: CoA-disulfide reductase [Omnitrophica bacterium GWA2_52_8]|nr:MAG: CoA-disulfide reductase [Omnitrophica bacterium GWA2_52_8]
MKILIVGGVAGGASCAARARRLSEDAEIVLVDRGSYVSFANCGLPYYVGNVIRDEKNLLVATPELFKNRFNIEVRLENEVTRIFREKRTVEVKELKTGRIYEEAYDALVLSPGAAPIKPPLPGIENDGIFVLRTIPDSRKIKKWIQEKKVKSAVIVGGGFIGLEMAENLARFGIRLSIIEMQNQVLPPFDPEMVSTLHAHLKSQAISLWLGQAVSGFEKNTDGSLTVLTKGDLRLKTDMVILSIGVRPEITLAKDCGLEIGARGGIRVNDQMKTSDDSIWAVGDAVESRDFITGEWITVPLAGPANRQGRVAADTLFKRPSRFRGIQGTAVCKVFELVASLTGANEKNLKRLNVPHQKVYLYPGHHAGYYPDAQPIEMKVLFSPKDGKILGAQAVGKEGAEKRIDVIAALIQKAGSVYDLEEAELCYAPQFGAAKDPVNMAGMLAANALRNDAPLAHWDQIDLKNVFLLDVRNPDEFAAEHIENALNIPLDQLREKMTTLPRDKEIYAYCGVGQRGYYATRALRCRGFNAFNLSGGMKSYKASGQRTTRWCALKE